MSRDRISRAEGSAWRMVDGEMIVVSATTANILSLNGTGAFVWERLDGTMSLDEIARDMSDAYDVERELATEHVAEFIETLEAEGLLESPAAVPAQ